jgi:hypothetical protein
LEELEAGPSPPATWVTSSATPIMTQAGFAPATDDNPEWGHDSMSALPQVQGGGGLGLSPAWLCANRHFPSEHLLGQTSGPLPIPGLSYLGPKASRGVATDSHPKPGMLTCHKHSNFPPAPRSASASLSLSLSLSVSLPLCLYPCPSVPLPLCLFPCCLL